MRKGADIRPQCFGTYVQDGASCALAAVAEGVGGRIDLIDRVGAIDVLLELRADLHAAADRTGAMDCPVEGCSRFAWISHLNDDHRWTREQIADWLEEKGF